MKLKQKERPDRQRIGRFEKPKLTKHIPRTRCSEQDRKDIETKARQAGLGLGEYIRSVCIGAKINVKHTPVNVEAVTELGALRVQIAGIANNLNRQTKAFHIHGEVDVMRFRAVVAQCEQSLKNLDALLASILP